MYKKGRNMHFVPSDGTLCELCLVPAEVREHVVITDKIARQTFYYSRWYKCGNRECKRKIFMKEDYKVENENAAARALKRQQQEYLDFMMPQF